MRASLRVLHAAPDAKMDLMDQRNRGERPIFVLGVDRSGTSVLAEVLSHWGAYAGAAERLGKPDDGNPQGYWEYAPMQEFVSQLTARAGASIWHAESRRLMRQQAADPELR